MGSLGCGLVVLEHAGAVTAGVLFQNPCVCVCVYIYIFIHTHTQRGIHLVSIYTGFLGLEIEYVKNLLAKKTGSA